jgi:hypothetical protein
MTAIFGPHKRLISTSRSPPNRKSMKIGRMREGPREAISLMPQQNPIICYHCALKCCHLLSNTEAQNEQI